MAYLGVAGVIGHAPVFRGLRMACTSPFKTLSETGTYGYIPQRLRMDSRNRAFPPGTVDEGGHSHPSPATALHCGEKEKPHGY